MHSRIFEDDFEYGFNPNEIDISVQQISLFYLLRRLKNQEIDLFADYQRHWNLWSKSQQSRLIESLLIRIPIPSFYFDSDNDGKWQVVDGLQRVTTFYNYIIKENFKLEGLEFLPQFNGHTFTDLPRELQRRIEEYTLTIHLINSGTPEQIKYIIFSRINTGGIKLNSQELRFALNQGKATRLLIELAESTIFKEATFNSVKPKRMLDFELINRFLAFYLFKQDYKGNLDIFMNMTLHEININKNIDMYSLKENFHKAMEYSIKIFEGFRFQMRSLMHERRYYDINERRGQVRKSLFDVVSVCLALLPIYELDTLVSRRRYVLEDMFMMLDETDFKDSVTSSSNNRRKVDYRFHRIQELLQRHLR